MPKLSICIPTYNRSALLAELLDSIVAQGHPEVEVVVSDDCSPDDTVAVAERYRRVIPSYQLIAQPVNLGLDRNFLAVVAAATGDYIWLMGDDDRLEPGGVGRLLDAIERWPGVSGLTVGVIDYDVAMREPVGVRAMPPTQLIEDVGTVFSEMAELLGFMSALVIDRRKWMAIAADPAAADFENYYVQVYVLGRVIERYGKWGVVQEPCVGFRTGNDQFETRLGWLQRLKVDTEAYDQIADALFADDPAARRAMRRRVFDAHVMARLFNAKNSADGGQNFLSAARHLYGRYRDVPRFWTRALPTLLAPKWMIRRARAAYKRFNPSSGAARARALRSA